MDVASTKSLGRQECSLTAIGRNWSWIIGLYQNLRLMLRGSGAQLQGSFKIHTLTHFCGLASMDPQIMAEGTGMGSWAAFGSTFRTKFYRPIAWSIGKCDSSWVPWYMVLVAGSKAKLVVVKTTEGTELFLGILSTASWCVSHLGTDLPSQNGSRQPWASLSFHKLLSGYQSSHRGTFFHGWLSNYCCWGRYK